MSRSGNRVTPASGRAPGAAPEKATTEAGGTRSGVLPSVRWWPRARPRPGQGDPGTTGRWGVARLVAQREAERRSAEVAPVPDGAAPEAVTDGAEVADRDAGTPVGDDAAADVVTDGAAAEEVADDPAAAGVAGENAVVDDAGAGPAMGEPATDDPVADDTADDVVVEDPGAGVAAGAPGTGDAAATADAVVDGVAAGEETEAAGEETTAGDTDDVVTAEGAERPAVDDGSAGPGDLPSPPAPRRPEPAVPPSPRPPLRRPPLVPRPPLPAPRRPHGADAPRPVVPNASDSRLPRPRVEPDLSLFGFARHTRGRLGARVFSVFFVLVFGFILVHTIASIV